MIAAELRRLVDRQAIADCLVRFARGMDRFDQALFLSAFHTDAVIAAGPFVGRPADLWSWAQPLHDAAQAATLHHLLNQSVDLEDDEAHVETHYLFVGRNRDNTNWLAGGRYIDRLTMRDGNWRILVRNTTVEWSGLLPAQPLPFADVPGIHGNGAPARDRSDPSYARPLVNRRNPSLPPG